MKIKSILAIAASGLMLAACQGGVSSDNKGLGELKNATPSDSLIYYFGQMEGNKFQKRAEKDTTFDNDQAKKAYIQGVQAGLNAAKNGDEAYNQGLFLGMQMAMNFQQFKEEYGIDLNRQLFMSSLSSAINADSVGDSQEAQREFYRLIGKFNEERDTRDKAAASETLTQEAQKMKLAKISDDVFGAVTMKTDSVALKSGDNVAFEMTLTDLNGKEITAPMPKKGKIGARNLAAPLNDMLASLKSGETGKFITSARALFGARVNQLGLEPTQVVVVDLKASVAPEDSNKDKNIRDPRTPGNKPKINISPK